MQIVNTKKLISFRKMYALARFRMSKNEHFRKYRLNLNSFCICSRLTIHNFVDFVHKHLQLHCNHFSNAVRVTQSCKVKCGTSRLMSTSRIQFKTFSSSSGMRYCTLYISQSKIVLKWKVECKLESVYSVGKVDKWAVIWVNICRIYCEVRNSRQKLILSESRDEFEI